MVVGGWWFFFVEVEKPKIASSSTSSASILTQETIVKYKVKGPKVKNEQIIKAKEKDRKRTTDRLKAFYLFGETEFNNCKHKFGYLGKNMKNKPIPDECFGCPKILDCFKQTRKAKKKKKPILTTNL